MYRGFGGIEDKILACKAMDTQDWVLGLVKSYKIHEQ
jgi:hypothetical protein